eukprot:4047539-Pleurochrysis_carterae.AAC.1
MDKSDDLSSMLPLSISTKSTSSGSESLPPGAARARFLVARNSRSTAFALKVGPGAGAAMPCRARARRSTGDINCEKRYNYSLLAQVSNKFNDVIDVKMKERINKIVMLTAGCR